jgi:hypothetical protein
MMVFYGQTVDGIPDRGYILYITALVMVLVAAVFVAARLGTRIVTRQIGLDDICLGFALVSSIVLTAAIDMCKLWGSQLCLVSRADHLQAVYHGYGRHKFDMKDMHAAMMVSDILREQLLHCPLRTEFICFVLAFLSLFSTFPFLTFTTHPKTANSNS